MLDDINITALRRPAPAHQGAMPAFTWAELEEALASIAASPLQREMAAHLVSATRKQAAFVPPAQVLREVLCLAWVIADETFMDTTGAVEPVVYTAGDL